MYTIERNKLKKDLNQYKKVWLKEYKSSLIYSIVTGEFKVY